MNKAFNRLFTLFLGILFLIFSITANSLAENTNQKKLIELKDIYVKGGISEAEYKAAIKILSTKEEKSDKKIRKEKKSFSLEKKSKKNKKFTFIKNKKDEDEKEITKEEIEELGEIVKFDISYYPENMRKEFKGHINNFKGIGQKAASYMMKNFTRSSSWGQKYPGKLIKSMAMYEIFFASKLYQERKSIERFNNNWEKSKFKYVEKKDKKAIRSLIGMNKGRKSMRTALGMTLKTSSKEAILKFWMLGEFLELGTSKKNAKIDKDLIERQKVLDLYKTSITTLKKKLEEKEENKTKEDKKS